MLSRRRYRLDPAEAGLIEIVRGAAAGCLMIQHIDGQGWVVAMTGARGATHGGAGRTFAQAWASIAPLAPPRLGGGRPIDIRFDGEGFSRRQVQGLIEQINETVEVR